ncbi:MAG: preprotein translocase subunit SecE [Flavobacteriales bacterium]|nr:preprotein translocase subunit SecE [Flavobacteriales bacterium]MBL4735474.1 preprotein translocase subunit SecE [Flavobacteriales bacterium]
MSVKGYIEETVNELLHKVSWPTWSDLQSSAIVVAIASVMIAIVIYIMDKTFSGIMGVLYSMFE